MLTDLERQAIQGILSSDFMDGATGNDAIDRLVWTWSANPFKNERTFSGVVSSLVKKGYVVSDTYGHVNGRCISITAMGMNAFLIGANTMIPTNEQIASLSGKDLVNAYNELATVAQRTHVTRFATRSDGVRRTTNLAEAVRERQDNLVSVGTEPFSRPSFYSNEAASAAHNPTDALLDEPDAPNAAAPTSNVVPLVRKTTERVKRLGAPVTALKTTAQPKTAKASRVSVASRCRELLATHTNEEIFAILQAEFGVDEKKRGYPGWYRADAKRKGK